MNADGSGLRRLTVPEAGPVHYVPAWSPDGRQLAYSCKRGDFFAICVADADGTSERQITNDAWDDSWPAWSPDGAHLAIQSNRDGYSQIYVLKADGAGGRLLTADLLYQNNMGPAWSPDAALISFTGGYGDVYIIAASGDSPPRRLTAETWTEGPPTWSPDGSLLAFHRFTGNIMDGVSASTCDIFVVRSSDGQGERNVTNHPACDWAPAWRPAR